MSHRELDDEPGRKWRRPPLVGNPWLRRGAGDRLLRRPRVGRGHDRGQPGARLRGLERGREVVLAFTSPMSPRGRGLPGRAWRRASR